MIESIEQAMIGRLKDCWPEHGGATVLDTFDIGNDFSDVISNSAVSIATESIGMRALPELSLELKPTIIVYVCFKQVANAKGRRFGVYPLVLGIIGILTGQDLDLEIDPIMPAGAAQEIFHETLKQKGMVGWKIPFTTSFDIDRLDNESVATALIAEGLSYHLDSDDVDNARDEILYE
jgi:Domain of unknown function (DUF1834)